MKPIEINSVYAEALDIMPTMAMAFNPYPHFGGKDKCVCYMEMITESIKAFDSTDDEPQKREIAVALLATFLNIVALTIRKEISNDTGMTIMLWAANTTNNHPLLHNLFSVTSIHDLPKNIADAMIAEDMHNMLDAQLAKLSTTPTNLN